jgi:hypothetical protein
VVLPQGFRLRYSAKVSQFERGLQTEFKSKGRRRKGAGGGRDEERGGQGSPGGLPIAWEGWVGTEYWGY